MTKIRTESWLWAVFPHRLQQREPVQFVVCFCCCSQSYTESGSAMPLVSGSSKHRPQPTIGPLLYTNIATNEIAPSAVDGTNVFARQPRRKQRFTIDIQRCLREIHRSLQSFLLLLLLCHKPRCVQLPDDCGEELDAVQIGNEYGRQDTKLSQESWSHHQHGLTWKQWVQIMDG